MNTLEFIGLGIAVFILSAAIDFAASRYVLAVGARRAVAAVGWTVGQWFASSLCLVVALKLTLWLLPVEAAGLAFGTYISVRRRTVSGPAITEMDNLPL